ncbi:hypothetical protein AB1Y20_014649 [Prymnesium parvum]|uniref:Sfi1 spindle body domain-containing protein n=1 Tax=Prymnesium parvum TaxID=97485 RepID=A0AB34IBF1_PRYPA
MTDEVMRKEGAQHLAALRSAPAYRASPRSLLLFLPHSAAANHGTHAPSIAPWRRASTSDAAVSAGEHVAQVQAFLAATPAPRCLQVPADLFRYGPPPSDTADSSRPGAAIPEPRTVSATPADLPAVSSEGDDQVSSALNRSIALRVRAMEAVFSLDTVHESEEEEEGREEEEELEEVDAAFGASEGGAHVLDDDNGGDDLIQTPLEPELQAHEGGFCPGLLASSPTHTAEPRWVESHLVESAEDRGEVTDEEGEEGGREDEGNDESQGDAPDPDEGGRELSRSPCAPVGAGVEHQLEAEMLQGEVLEGCAPPELRPPWEAESAARGSPPAARSAPPPLPVRIREAAASASCRPSESLGASAAARHAARREAAAAAVAMVARRYEGAGRDAAALSRTYDMAYGISRQVLKFGVGRTSPDEGLGGGGNPLEGGELPVGGGDVEEAEAGEGLAWLEDEEEAMHAPPPPAEWMLVHALRAARASLLEALSSGRAELSACVERMRQLEVQCEFQLSVAASVPPPGAMGRRQASSARRVHEAGRQARVGRGRDDVVAASAAAVALSQKAASNDQLEELAKGWEGTAFKMMLSVSLLAKYRAKTVFLALGLHCVTVRVRRRLVMQVVLPHNLALVSAVWASLVSALYTPPRTKAIAAAHSRVVLRRRLMSLWRQWRQQHTSSQALLFAVSSHLRAVRALAFEVWRARAEHWASQTRRKNDALLASLVGAWRSLSRRRRHVRRVLAMIACGSPEEPSDGAIASEWRRSMGAAPRGVGDGCFYAYEFQHGARDEAEVGSAHPADAAPAEGGGAHSVDAAEESLGEEELRGAGAFSLVAASRMHRRSVRLLRRQPWDVRQVDAVRLVASLRTLCRRPPSALQLLLSWRHRTLEEATELLPFWAHRTRLERMSHSSGGEGMAASIDGAEGEATGDVPRGREADAAAAAVRPVDGWRRWGSTRGLCAQRLRLVVWHCWLVALASRHTALHVIAAGERALLRRGYHGLRGAVERVDARVAYAARLHHRSVQRRHLGAWEQLLSAARARLDAAAARRATRRAFRRLGAAAVEIRRARTLLAAARLALAYGGGRRAIDGAAEVHAMSRREVEAALHARGIVPAGASSGRHLLEARLVAAYAAALHARPAAQCGRGGTAGRVLLAWADLCLARRRRAALGRQAGALHGRQVRHRCWGVWRRAHGMRQTLERAFAVAAACHAYVASLGADGAAALLLGRVIGAWGRYLVVAREERRERECERAAACLWRATVGTRVWDGWRLYVRQRRTTRAMVVATRRRSLQQAFVAMIPRTRRRVDVARRQGVGATPRQPAEAEGGGAATPLDARALPLREIRRQLHAMQADLSDLSPLAAETDRGALEARLAEEYRRASSGNDTCTPPSSAERSVGGDGVVPPAHSLSFRPRPRAEGEEALRPEGGRTPSPAGSVEDRHSPEEIRSSLTGDGTALAPPAGEGPPRRQGIRSGHGQIAPRGDVESDENRGFGQMASRGAVGSGRDSRCAEMASHEEARAGMNSGRAEVASRGDGRSGVSSGRAPMQTDEAMGSRVPRGFTQIASRGEGRPGVHRGLAEMASRADRDAGATSGFTQIASRGEVRSGLNSRQAEMVSHGDRDSGVDRQIASRGYVGSDVTSGRAQVGCVLSDFGQMAPQGVEGSGISSASTQLVPRGHEWPGGPSPSVGASVLSSARWRRALDSVTRQHSPPLTITQSLEIGVRFLRISRGMRRLRRNALLRRRAEAEAVRALLTAWRDLVVRRKQRAARTSPHAADEHTRPSAGRGRVGAPLEHQRRQLVDLRSLSSPMPTESTRTSCSCSSDRELVNARSRGEDVLLATVLTAWRQVAWLHAKSPRKERLQARPHGVCDSATCFNAGRRQLLRTRDAAEGKFTFIALDQSLAETPSHFFVRHC